MPVIRNIGTLATCRPEGSQDQIHAIESAALVWKGDSILWVGPDSQLPAEYQDWESWDVGGRLVIPGLVDCHTHLAFGGWRANEFEERIRGKSYLEIARSGGGICSTVAATRQISYEALVKRGLRFLREMSELGTTTVECKTGYGLTVKGEMKLLQVYKELGKRQPLRIIPTLLAAHIFPPEYQDNRAGYVELVQKELIPAVAEQQLAKFSDVFVEDSAFTVEEARSIFEVGNAHGLRPKLHADQLTDSGGASLAAEVGATSADHLEYSSDEGIGKMAEAGVVAVGLPLASLYLKQKPLEAKRWIEAGVPLAIASDFNPGSAPSYDLPLAMMLACNTQRLTPADALKGATIYAAKALGVENETGSLEVGKAADFAIIDSPDPNHWLYHFRPNACLETVVRGSPIKNQSWPHED